MRCQTCNAPLTWRNSENVQSTQCTRCAEQHNTARRCPQCTRKLRPHGLGAFWCGWCERGWERSELSVSAPDDADDAIWADPEPDPDPEAGTAMIITPESVQVRLRSVLAGD